MVILGGCITLSLAVDKDNKQSLTLLVIFSCYMTSPLLRQHLQSLGIFNYDKGFFEFYTYYNIVLAVFLCFLNYENKRATPLYIIYGLAATFNWWCFTQWDCPVTSEVEGYPFRCYSTLIYDNYEFVNRLLMDNVILAVVALNSRKRLFCMSVVLIVTPYLIN